MNGSTVVIDPPDGSMKRYLESLQNLLDKKIEAIAPGHGDVLEEPGSAIRWIIDHRLARESEVVEALTANPGSTTSHLVSVVYREVDPRLHRIAERSLLAHLIKLEQEARARVSGDRWKLVHPE
jgi:glyoxylase-like metal-dependent hydrolase (beta-lactamase superfamily II)